MANRFGTILIFREDASETEVRNALETLRATGILAEDQFGEYPMLPTGHASNKWRNVPYHLETYDDEVGAPVWYMP